MSTVQPPHLHLEIAHILFLDLVGYSKLLIDEQKELLEELNQIVRNTGQFRAADAEGKLTRLPTGDGMVLVFSNNPEAPLECALEVSKAVQNHPRLKLRMGIHSGPVNPVADVNDRSNLAGAGINMAQRVMSCGDAGHILLSRHFAEDLEHYAHWQSSLHDVGEVEVKHGVKISLVNFYTDQLGNSGLPEKIKQARREQAAAARARAIRKRGFIAAGLLLLLFAIGFWKFHRQTMALLPNAKSIAVLPFENLSRDPDNAFFGDGMQDEILNDLAKIADLKVISRTSVMQYKIGVKRNLREIANELGVAYLVEGSVQRAANRVRVSAQLIDARTDIHLWAEHYDRPLDNVFAIQSEIAQIVADQLQAKLSPAEKAAIEQRPTADLGAYDRYVRARALLDTVNANTRGRENLFQAVRLLDQAVARDPGFLLAYCELVSAHDQLHFYGIDHTPARLELANQALRKAMQLGPGRGEVHLAIALHAYRSYDYEHARSEVAIAQRTLPNEPWVFALPAYMDRRQGHWAESIRNLERALELDPRNLLTLQQLAASYLCLRRYADEALVLDRMLTIAPTDANTRVWRARVDLESRADPRPAHITIHEILAEDSGAAAGFAQQWFLVALCEHDPAEATRAVGFMPPEGISPNNTRYPRSFLEALAARARGDAAAAHTAFTAARVEMQHIVDAQPDYAEAISVLGMVDAGLDRKEDALREGRRAIELLPITKDALNGTELKRNLAIIYAWTGEKELALKELADALQLPGVFLTYGELRLHPYWDSLRDDPRFDELVEKSKKPVALK